jgi:hypothetical protein
MDDDRPVLITDVLNRAGVPKRQHEKRMNQVKHLIGNLQVWRNGLSDRCRNYGDCTYNCASVVYIKKKDEQKMFEVFSDEGWLLGATNE